MQKPDRIEAPYLPVELPTDAEKERSINIILAAALPKPQRLRSDLPALLRSLGLRGLFFGVEDCAFWPCCWRGCCGVSCGQPPARPFPPVRPRCWVWAG